LRRSDFFGGGGGGRSSNASSGAEKLSFGGAGGGGGVGISAVDPLLFLSFSDAGFELLADIDRNIIFEGCLVELLR
jgi:uncharacterized spore protein YtfJ